MSHVKKSDLPSNFFFLYIGNASHYIQDVMDMQEHWSKVHYTILHEFYRFLHNAYFITWDFHRFHVCTWVNIYYIVLTWILPFLHVNYMILTWFLQLLHDNYMVYQLLCHGMEFDTGSFCCCYPQPIFSMFMRKSAQDHPPGWL